ncbi:MAG: STAS domain-containing protein [Brevinematia bacterium]
MRYSRSVLPNNAAEYVIEGDFTIFFLNNIKIEIEKDIATNKISHFIFDLKKVNYVDSAAISLLIMAGKYNDSKGQKLIIKNPTDVVKRIIDNAELSFIDYQYD